MTEDARTWRLAQSDHPKWGARPLRRIIRRWVREPLADYMLEADPPPGTRVEAHAGDEGLVFAT